MNYHQSVLAGILIFAFVLFLITRSEWLAKKDKQIENNQTFFSKFETKEETKERWRVWKIAIPVLIFLFLFMNFIFEELYK